MPRSDLLMALVRAATKGDQVLLRRALESMVAEEREKQHHVLADRLADYLRPNGNHEGKGPLVNDDRIGSLLLELVPRKTLGDLILSEPVSQACAELVEEQQRSELLRAYGLEPRHRVLLIGPPGNGKTSLAEALAEALVVPLLVVRYDGVIGSYLGETAVRLRILFDHVRTRRCVLFFDEFDTLGKERGDLHETGEIKRVVSSLLMQVDSLPSHVLAIAATNHPELLDRAVWRRFQLRLQLPAPTRSQLKEWFTRLEGRLAQPLGHQPEVLASKLVGVSFAEIEEFGTDILRRRALSIADRNLRNVIDERLKQWQARLQAQMPSGG